MTIDWVAVINPLEVSYIWDGLYERADITSSKKMRKYDIVDFALDT